MSGFPNLPEDDYVSFVQRIARVVARRTGRMGSDFDDLVGAGTVGLVEALHRYDPARTASFKTFASYRVRGAMLDYLRSLDPLGRRRRERVKRDGLPQPVIPVGENAARDIPAVVPDADHQIWAHELLTRVPRSDQRLLRDLYWDGQLHREIGIRLRVTPGRVSQLHSRALERLRDAA